MKHEANFDLLGLHISRGNIGLMAKSILSNIDSESRTLVVTPNSDHFIRWLKEPGFRELYSRAQYRLIDGAPLLWIARILGGRDVHRITGVDLTFHILKTLRTQKIPIAIIGGTPHTMEQAVKKIKIRFPEIEIFLESTPTQDELHSEVYVSKIVQQLESEVRKIVLICLGSPKQEEFFFSLDNSN